MGVVSFSARNKLVYPAGRLAGLDSTHPATRGLNGMVFPLPGGRAINLGGTAGFAKPVLSAGGSMSSAIVQYLGPSLLNAMGSMQFTAPVLPTTAAGNAYTFAAFVNPTDAATTTVFISFGNANQSSEGIYSGIIGGNFGIRLSGTVTFDSGIAAVNGIPYFYVVSLIYQGSNLWDHNHAVLQLRTGQLTTSRTTGTSQGPITNTTLFFEYGGSGGFGAPVYIGPAMTSTAALGLPQLIAWANDPWAFWYPSQTASQAASAARPPTMGMMGVGP